MSNATRLPDAAAREAALDPRRSFIVQAPAGSGKTELLIQRFLRLLCVVSEPEEVLAITFTRKAAGEMRTRIEKAMRAAGKGEEPSAPHLRLGYRLARDVLEHARKRDWQLNDFPNRLRISTIDAVNAGLARRVPLSAGVTSQFPIASDPKPVYRAAIRETLLLSEDPGQDGRNIRALLEHCDNRTETVEAYLQIMLERRDQWLRHTGTGRADDPVDRRQMFEASLHALVETYLRSAHAALPDEEREELLTLLQSAGESIRAVKPESPLAAWHQRREFPQPRFADIDLWRGMQLCLQTRDGTWRKKLTVNDGFPPGGGEAKLRKEHLLALLARLDEHDEFRDALHAVASLPDTRYTDSQWALIDALWQILPLTVAMLKNIFADRNVTDYTEIAQEAMDALGNGAVVTDLRLALDDQIRHILLDEFQDTSRSQYVLIERLTEGWESETDRSLFLVGDPMQSIYRFREAEVGLFLAAREHGIGGLKLNALTLQANFRSIPGIVNWFNRAFSSIFPKYEDAATGAIAFVPSQPMLDGPTDPGVQWHPLPYGQTQLEANRVVDLVEQTFLEWRRDQAHQEKREIGILVRSRRHAVEIGRALHRRAIGFTAADLETLDEQSPAQDLLALTRALMHPGDRIAWLGLLRAPWCGLTLVDLHALAGEDHDACIWTLMNDAAVLERLSADGRARLERCRLVLDRALERFGSIALRDLVENAWLQLGGPATLGEDIESEFFVVDHFFDLLDTLEAEDDGLDLLRLLADQSITRGGSEDRVRIMTIHKAKGLEFDTVILPGLARSTQHSDRPPLLFHEFELDDGTPGLIAAPVAGSNQDGDAIHDLLWGFEKERDRWEQDRVLYVAVTRARRRLHLFAGLSRDTGDDPAPRPPANHSLLGRLWPVAATEIDFTDIDLPVKVRQEPDTRCMDMQTVSLWRLPADWRSPAPTGPGVTPILPRDTGREESPEFEWASAWTKHAGSVVHRWLQFIAEEGVQHWDADRLVAAEPGLRRALGRAGVGMEDTGEAMRRVTGALLGSLQDPRGRWLLGNHDQAANEFPVTTLDAETGTFRHHVIDRTFICEDGIRWIIDYKTGKHEGGDIEAFLLSEVERYRPQLARYRDALRRFDDRPIRTALYFPLMQIFHIVDCDGLQGPGE